jgi:CRP/FNR family transcriptional regulator, cyclic AMP receptor protein
MAERSSLDLVRESLWARSLTPQQLQLVETTLQERRVAAGGYVCRKGEPVEQWVGIVDGLVKMTGLSPTGKLTTLTGLPEGAWFGEGSLLKDEPRRYDVIALRDSRVALMPRATFLALLDGSIAFNRFLLIQLNERLGQFIGQVEFDRLLNVEARVARCLAAMFNQHLYPATRREVQISQEEIGYLSDLSRQRVNLALKALENAGLVQVEYGRIVVLDLPGLRNFAG